MFDKLQKKEKSKKIVEYWKELHANAQGLNRQTLIKNYLEFTILKSNIREPEIIIKNKLISEDHSSTPDWDALHIAEDISKWAKRYKILITFSYKDDMDEIQSRLKFFKDTGMKTIWGFLIPLSLRIEEDKLIKGIDKRTFIPIKLFRLLEYVIVCKQLFGNFRPQYWDSYFRDWRTLLGNKEMTIEQILNTINNEIMGKGDTVSESIYVAPNDFIEKYDEYVQNTLGSEHRLSGKKKRVHARILMQVEDNINPDKSVNVKKLSVDGNNLEHILPLSHLKWSTHNKVKMNDPSLLDDSQLIKMADYKQHIGNHTILFHNWNKKLSNHTFFDKKYSPSCYHYEPNNERPCYNNCNLHISKSLVKYNKFELGTLIKRGHLILTNWMETCGLNTKELNDEYKEYSELLYTDKNDVNIETLLVNSESYKLEFKAVFWKTKNKQTNSNDKEMPLRIASTLNAFANTKGGKLIIGRQNQIKNIFDIDGIDFLINEYKNKIKKNDPDETLINDIVNSIKSSIPDNFLLGFKVWIEKLSFGKSVIIIEVQESNIKPIPFVCNGAANFYFYRHGASTSCYLLQDKVPIEEDTYENELVIKDKFIIIGEFRLKGKGQLCKRIGPFRSKYKANRIRKQFYTSGIKVTDSHCTKIDSKIGICVAPIIKGWDRGIKRKSGKWKCINEKGVESRDNFWLFDVLDVPDNWTIPDELYQK